MAIEKEVIASCPDVSILFLPPQHRQAYKYSEDGKDQATYGSHSQTEPENFLLTFN